MRIAAAVTEFFYDRDLTPKSREWYEQHLRHFYEWCECQGIRDCGDVNSPLIRRYLAYLTETPSAKGRPMSSHTRHGYARAVRAFANFCTQEGFVDESQVSRIKMPKRDERIIRPFNRPEMDSLLRACRDPKNPILASRDRAVITMLLDTGVRANELCTLTLDRTVFTASDAHIIVNGKGRKQRQVWLGKDSRLALHRYIHEHRPDTTFQEVFLTRHARPLHIEGLQSLLDKLRDRTGKQFHVNPHKFRHTFAYWYMATRQGDVMRLSRILGHSSVVVTENYLRAFGSQDASGGSLLDTLRDMR